MCKRDSEIKKRYNAQKEILDSNVEFIRKSFNSKDNADAAASNIFKAAYSFSLKEIDQETNKANQIQSSVNFLFILVGLVLAGFVSLFVHNNDRCKPVLAANILLIIAFSFIALESILLIITFTYFKKATMPSPMKTANRLFKEYKNNQDHYNEDKEAIHEADFVYEIEKFYLQLQSENTFKLKLINICSFSTIILFGLLIAIICVLI